MAFISFVYLVGFLVMLCCLIYLLKCFWQAFVGVANFFDRCICRFTGDIPYADQRAARVIRRELDEFHPHVPQARENKLDEEHA